MKLYFIVPFTQKFELLCLFVHENTVQMASFNATNFDCFVAPSHDLTSSNEGN